jgi:WD40 repeat protein
VFLFNGINPVLIYELYWESKYSLEGSDMTKRMLMLVIAFFFISACSLSKPKSTATIPATGVVTATVKATVIPATQAPPTKTPTAAPTPTETPLPIPDVITVENAAQLMLAARTGDGEVVQLLWMPGGEELVVLSSFNLRMLSVENGKELWKVETGSMQVQMALSADGTSLVSNTQSGIVTEWDIKTGKKGKTHLEARKNLFTTSLSPDGSLISFSDNNTVVDILEVNSGKVIQEKIKPSLEYGIWQTVYSPDQKQLLIIGITTSYQMQIQEWEIDTKKFVRGLQGVSIYNSDVSYSPDGGLILSAYRDEDGGFYKLYLWNINTGQQIHKIDLRLNPTTYLVLPDSKTVLVAYETPGMEQYNLSTGESMANFDGLNSPVVQISCSPDGSECATVGRDGTLTFWDMSGKTILEKYNLELETNEYMSGGKVALSGDGHLLAMTGLEWHEIKIIDLEKWEFTDRWNGDDGEYTVPALSPDGKLMAVVFERKKVDIWDLSNDKAVIQFDTNHNEDISHMMFNPDGSQLAVLSYGQLTTWDVATGKKKFDFSGYLTFDYSPDGLTLISDNVDLGLYVWDVVSGKRLANLPAEFLYDVDYSPNGKYIAAGGWEYRKDWGKHNNLVYLVDAVEREQLPNMMTGHLSTVVAVTFSPDGRLLVSGDNYGNIIIWEIPDGRKVVEISGVTSSPMEILFTPDGRKLIIAGEEGVAQIFQVSPPGEIRLLAMK